MIDIRTEIRAAFEREQSEFPPPAALRAQVVAAVNSQARMAAPVRQRAERNLSWVMVAAAILLTIAIVAGFMAVRLVSHPILVKPGPAPQPASWTATGNMVTPRSGHTATLLPDGKVLVEGGAGISSVLASAELYDPSTRRWAATGNMITSRASHTATLLPNGKVLVAGGYDHINAITGFDIVASAELYDPSTGRWTATGSMVTPHWGHTATLLDDGKVLVAGGELGNRMLASAELYDPSTGAWTATGNMVTPRSFHTAALLPDGKVLVAGGGLGSRALASAELYDPSTGRWSATGNMVTPRTGHTATLLPDGMVLVAGGDGIDSAGASAELYDASTGKWNSTGGLVASTAAQPATLLLDGTVLVVSDAGTASLYHPDTGSWTAPGITVTRHDDTATLLPDGAVLVAGGWGRPGDGQALASAELYNPGTPLALPAVGAVAPGTYFMANPDPSCVGGCAAYNRIIFTLPAGWAIGNGLVYKHLNQDDEVAFSAWTVDKVYDDPCHWQGSSLSALDLAGHSHAANGAIVLGSYKGGLAHQALRGPLPRALTPVTLASIWGGEIGRVGALRIALSVPAGLDISTCDLGQFRSWTEWHVIGGANSHHAPGQLDTVYQVDVDRRPLVIDVSSRRAASVADLAELKAILASMVIDRG